MKELKHLNKYFYKYRYKLLLGLAITIVARVFSLIMPKYVNKTLTTVEDSINNGIPLDHIKNQLIEYIVIIIGSSILYALFTFLMRQTIINISRYIEFDLKNEVFRQYEKLSISFYKRNRTGDLMNRISEDVGKVRMYAGPAIMYSIQTLTLFVCIIPLMLHSSPTLTLYTVIPLPVLSVLIYYISKTIHKRTTIVQEFLSELSTFSQETFSGIGVIKAYGIEGRINDELNQLAIDGRNKSMDLAKIQAWFFPLMLLLIGLSTIAVVFVGGKLYIDGKIDSVGTIAEFMIYVLMLTWPVATVGWVSSIVQQAEASQKRINEFLKEIPTIQNTQTKHTPVQGTISFKNVSFTYEDTYIQALKNVTFEVKKGETLAIIGKTGSGKSTVLDLIGRMYDVTSGEILIDNTPIKEMNLNDLRNAIGSVPQDAFLFSDTIKNNIRFGKADATDQEIVQAAKKASVHKNIEKFSKKYDTVLGERGITLSGGQKQRVSIARALIKDAGIYLFDDCLSAVDTETEEKILNNLLETAHDKTTIIVSHRISSAKNADRILILDNGEIVQQGTHNQLIVTEGYYKELYLNQLHEKESH